jgi:tricarballylate dehydrogenase
MPSPVERLSQLPSEVDVLVMGGGNAGLCAALSARHAGASVLLVEKAPRPFRGGNSRHTRDVRYMHESICPYVTGTYLEDEFWEDLRRVTGGETNEALARLTIRSSIDSRSTGWSGSRRSAARCTCHGPTYSCSAGAQP